MVGGGDLTILVDPNSVLFLSRTSNLGKKRGRGIYTPPGVVAVATARAGSIPSLGRLIWPELEIFAQNISLVY
jgi:hypothetical protein